MPDGRGPAAGGESLDVGTLVPLHDAGRAARGRYLVLMRTTVINFTGGVCDAGRDAFAVGTPPLREAAGLT